VAFSAILKKSNPGGLWVKKQFRLRKRSDFNYTYRKGKSLANYCLVLIYRKTNDKVTRVGFSISKKFGSAVKRNRIKRQLREIYASKINNIKAGYDLIFVVRKGAKDADFHRLKNQMENLLNRAGLLENQDKESS